ncbi:hypothetical protein [Desulforamulus aeronauticus]|uniref:Uncharacterized protein n=1 Tax=Desulforamulus aeronauticus DSM 10349 TaxID=1121421 RepID=A0A1M6U1S5_9FIRM|nr:hypothetical protein [Desulforamulus aeronauticus]SHK63100.1 hypothetical protein SAMN02745123_02562 [Desulforamulus aeronauticus DSM 10349]
MENILNQILEKLGQLERTTQEGFTRVDERFKEQDERFDRIAVMELLADSKEVKKDVAEIKNTLTYVVADIEILQEDNHQNKREIKRIKKIIEA